MKSYRELKVWSAAMDLAVMIYRITRGFPRDEVYGLVAQIRRSVVSVPSNIAEGCARDSTKEFLHFISIALGSLAETETQIELAGRLNYVIAEERLRIASLIAEVGKMLHGLQKALRKRL